VVVGGHLVASGSSLNRFNESSVACGRASGKHRSRAANLRESDKTTRKITSSCRFRVGLRPSLWRGLFAGSAGPTVCDIAHLDDWTHVPDSPAARSAAAASADALAAASSFSPASASSTAGAGGGSRVVHRADARQLLTKVKQRAPIFGTLAVLSVLRSGPDALVFCAVAAACIVLVAWLYLRTASVELEVGAATYRHFGLSTTVQLDGRQTGVLCRLKTGFEGLPTLAARGGDGRRVLITGTWFTDAALRHVADHCRLVALPTERLVTGAVADAAAPGALPFWHRRPMLTTTAAVLLLIGGAVGWAFVTTGS
jgi:hypothetical protein